MIRLRNLTKRFGEKVAVDNLNLDIEEGELFIFLGPNAAGKTTTIKMMAGLLKPTEGIIEIAGVSVVKNRERAKEFLSYIPDFPYLYEKLTPYEMFLFFQDVYSIPEKTARERTEEMISLFGIDEFRDILIENLSHGMKQRVVIALSLFRDPQVLIIDEPMVGLDPKTARLFKDVLKNEAQKGKTIFLSTHQLYVAQELADKIGIIHKGKLLAYGSLEDIMKSTDKNDNLESVFLDIINKNQ